MKHAGHMAEALRERTAHEASATFRRLRHAAGYGTTAAEFETINAHYRREAESMLTDLIGGVEAAMDDTNGET